MTTKFSPIIAMLLLAGAEVAVPTAAKSTEAHAATLDGMTPVRVRCFMAPMGNKWPMADDRTGHAPRLALHAGKSDVLHALRRRSRHFSGHAAASCGMSDLQQDFPKDLKDRAADLLVCLRFSTRLPIPRLEFEPAPADASLAASAAMLPVAGALIGCVGAVILWLCIRLGLPSPLAALLSIGSLIVLTGALHEDGVADFADSLGGASAEQRLAIMKDSRIGSFGSLALILVTLGRVASLDMLTVHSLGLACTVLVSAGTISRCFALLPLYMLDPARSDGLGATSSIGEDGSDHRRRPDTVIALLPLLAGAGLGRIIIALILCGLVAYGVTLWARRLIAGQTGDVAGAIQQVTELMAYLVFTAHP